MPVRFLHSADLHIGRSFANAPADQAAALRAARMDVIDSLADAARRAGVGRILLAGDVFDRTDMKRETVLAAFRRMQLAAPIVWHVIPGNHDHGCPGSVWRTFTPPPNVIVHLEAAPITLPPLPSEPDIILLPAPLLARSAAEDPTAWFDAAPSPVAAVRLGLAHGAAYEMKDGSATTKLAPDRASRAGLDYLALGDWHGRLRVADRAWYPGTPEPDEFSLAADQATLCRGGEALLVEIDAPGAPPRITALPVTRHVRHRVEAMLADVTEIDPLVDRLLALDPDPRRLALRLSLMGTLKLADIEAAQRAIEDRLRPALFWLDLDDQVEPEPTSAELAAIDAPGGAVAEVARRLDALRADPKQGRAAARALTRLWGLRGLVQETRR